MTTVNVTVDMPRNAFRPLDSFEIQVVESALSRGRLPCADPRSVWIDKLAVSYESLPGGFYVCILMLDTDHPLLYRGVSRRSYRDKHNSIKGRMLAFSRAILHSRACGVPAIKEN